MQFHFANFWARQLADKETVSVALLAKIILIGNGLVCGRARTRYDVAAMMDTSQLRPIRAARDSS
jgi:hypothetical protein